VFTLTNVIHDLCSLYGYKCLSSSFKGGAQRHGSVHSELKIFENTDHDHRNYSVQLLPGELDILIGLEIWEALRYQSYCNKNTRLYINAVEEKLYTDRFGKDKLQDPFQSLRSLEMPLVMKNYTLSNETGAKTPANYLLFTDVLENKDLPFKAEDLENVFSKKIKKEKN
jgi:Pyruvate/2-oxoacid:ferredoxin oxidoreductase gamma subunit